MTDLGVECPQASLERLDFDGEHNVARPHIALLPHIKLDFNGSWSLGGDSIRSQNRLTILSPRSRKQSPGQAKLNVQTCSRTSNINFSTFQFISTKRPFPDFWCTQFFL